MGGQWNFSIFVFDFALVCKILLSCSLGISTCGRRLARTGGEEDLGSGPRTALASAMVSSAADGPSELGRRCPSWPISFLECGNLRKGHDLEPCSLQLRQSLEGLRAGSRLPTAPQHLEQPAHLWREVWLAVHVVHAVYSGLSLSLILVFIQ